MRKIAFCFLIYDIIELEELWYKFFENIDISRYSIYIHYKTAAILKYFEKYKLPKCMVTTYAHISLVEAQNLLLSSAIWDLDNTNFIFLSGTCIPLKSFEDIYNYLNPEFSYFNLNENQDACFPRCDKVLKWIKKEQIYKSSQWCILNRKHTIILLKNKEYIRWFKDTYAADEHCYITYIYYKNLQNEIIATYKSYNESTTFTNWGNPNSNYIYKYEKCALKNYTSITLDELTYLLDSKCLFGRKFRKLCLKSFNPSIYLDKITSVLEIVLEKPLGNSEPLDNLEIF